jgi:transcriptional antiterminator RfaH
MLHCTPRLWYVAQTQPHAEMKAAIHLGRQGMHTYLPRYLKRRSHARRVEMVPAPLFPRYLFIAAETESPRWRSIQSTIGVTHLVCNGDVPATVTNKVIEELRLRENDRGFIKLDQRGKYKQGDQLRLLDGAFVNCFGLYEGMRENDRIAVLLELLGRKVRVTVDAEAVAAA